MADKIDLKAEFDKIDADGSGELDLGELTNLCGGDEELAKQLLAAIEEIGGGNVDKKVSFDELKTAFEKLA